MAWAGRKRCMLLGMGRERQPVLLGGLQLRLATQCTRAAASRLGGTARSSAHLACCRRRRPRRLRRLSPRGRPVRAAPQQASRCGAAAMPSGKSRKTHSKGRKTKLCKSGVRKIFHARHIDQVRAWWAPLLGRGQSGRVAAACWRWGRGSLGLAGTGAGSGSTSQLAAVCCRRAARVEPAR